MKCLKFEKIEEIWYNIVYGNKAMQSLPTTERRNTMSVQTSADIKKQREQALIERFGVKIGRTEWNEIQDYYFYWSAEVSRMSTYYSDKNRNIPEEYREKLDRQRMFFEAVRNVHNYMYKLQSRMSDFTGELEDYWIINPAPASYLVSCEGISPQWRVASFQELIGFFALGVARRCWSIEDVLDRPVSECRARKLLVKN